MGGRPHGLPDQAELAQGPIGLLADGDEGGRIQDLDNAVEDPRVPKSTGSRRPALCHVVVFGLSK
jgi:hypothetical protein